MNRISTLWNDVVDSLWFLPALLTLLGGMLAVLLVRFNDAIVGDADRADIWWLFGGTAEGAKSVLESISGSIITVTGVVFSVTIIALQLASSQFTPRVLRQFMASRGNQLVLGVFIGTFTFTLLVQRTIRSEDAGDEFVPAVAVTMAVLLALTSIGFLIYFIDHAARSIQASVIIDSATGDTRRALRRVFPDEAAMPAAPAEDGAGSDAGAVDREDAPWAVESRGAGYVQSVDRAALREAAAEHGLLIRMEVEIGEFVLPGHHVMSVWPASAEDGRIAGMLCDAMIMGHERTPHQDVKHGIIELMDIAVKAMSPSVNDPTTAVNAVHRLSEVLLDLAWRDRGADVERGDDGRPVVVMRRPRFGDCVDLAFNQVRHYAAGNPTVAVTLLASLGELAALSPEDARPPVVQQMQHVIRTAHIGITHQHDLARVDHAAAAALRRASAPVPRRRIPA
jgi:uncharacterized membrane protein